MKLLRRFLVTCLALCTLLLIISFTAFAGDGDTIEISTPGELMDILNTAPSEAWDTSGKTYVLQSDIEIDTSGLSATYYSTDNSKTRNFMGVLDGGGHTITVVENADGEPSKPLFDRITGTSENDYAGIKNLNVVFKGDVEGTTLASTLTCAQINDVKITFEKNIIFAEPLYGSSGQYAIATGVFGFPTQSTPIILNNVSVVGKGIIGSKDAHDKAYVMAAGIFSESNFSAGDIIFDGIDVNVKGIYAVSNYKPAPSAYSDCCAAGIASGWSQVNLNLGNAYVNISDDIYAHSTNGSDADAYGLGYHLLSMYNCDVKVG